MKKILIVEDEVFVADLLSQILVKIGYELTEHASSYEEAIQKFGDSIFDLVLLDITLGGDKTGIDVANFIRLKSDVPYIYLSSHADSETLEMAKKTMPYAYLVKPFNQNDVFAAIEVAFNNYDRFKSRNDQRVTQEEVAKLSKAEKNILQKVNDGMTSKDIAKELNISVSTVKNHRHNICSKFDLPNTTHSLVNWLLRNSEAISLE